MHIYITRIYIYIHIYTIYIYMHIYMTHIYIDIFIYIYTNDVIHLYTFYVSTSFEHVHKTRFSTCV